MEFQLTTPQQASPLTSVRLLTSTYSFDTNAIVISLMETHADGSWEVKPLELTPEEVQTYFDTPLSPAGFRGTFVAAFAAAVQAHYPAAVVSSA